MSINEEMRQDVDAILGRASLPRHTMTVCLDADLRAEWVQAEVELEEAREHEERDRVHEVVTQTLAGRGDVRHLQDRVLDLQRRMEEGALHLTMQALPRGRYRQLLREHKDCPDGDPTCQRFRFCVDQVFPALFQESLVDPALSPEQQESLFGLLADGQVAEILDVCIKLNHTGASVPFSPAASARTSTSAPASKRRQPSGSRSASSTDKNARKSRSTSTTTRGGSSGR